MHFSDKDLPMHFSDKDLPMHFSDKDLPMHFSDKDLPMHFSDKDLPMTVIDGLSFPSGLKVSLTSTLANGLLGLGSLGVPSTRVHCPMVTFQPITLYSTQQWSYQNITALIHEPGYQ